MSTNDNRIVNDPFQAEVGDPTLAGFPDGAQLPRVITGRNRDQLVSEIHGKYYHASHRGNLFRAGTGIAGSIIPLAPPTSQLQTALTLFNPLFSGKNAELVSLQIGALSATTAVIGSLVWSCSFNVASIATKTAAGVLTSGPITTFPTSQSSVDAGRPAGSVCRAYATATTPATVNAYLMAGFDFGSVTDNSGPAQDIVFYDGTILIPPGTIISLNCTVAQSVNFLQELVWTEWPI